MYIGFLNFETVGRYLLRAYWSVRPCALLMFSYNFKQPSVALDFHSHFIVEKTEA